MVHVNSSCHDIKALTKEKVKFQLRQWWSRKSVSVWGFSMGTGGESRPQLSMEFSVDSTVGRSRPECVGRVSGGILHGDGEEEEGTGRRGPD